MVVVSLIPADNADFADQFKVTVYSEKSAQICGKYYPALSKIVKDKCEAFDLAYNCLPSLRKAVISHFRSIRLLGKKADSIYYTDDVLVKNGKILLYDEKQRLFAK